MDKGDNDAEVETAKDDIIADESETADGDNDVSVPVDPVDASDAVPKSSCMEISQECTEKPESISPASEEKSDTEIPAEKEETIEIKETVEFSVIYNKKKHCVIFPLDDTVESLKSHVESFTGVPSSMQKIMFKGKMQDSATLREQKVTKGSKIMVVGCTVTDIMSVAAPDPKTLKEETAAAAAASKEPLSKQKPHKTILEKHGKPDDVIAGIKNVKEPLPEIPVCGMYNKYGGKVRLTFKLDQDQLWIGTKERTDKMSLGSIKAIVNEPIEGHDEYQMIGLQLGPTEASRYWIYWVPTQYVDAIKDAILGKWQYF